MVGPSTLTRAPIENCASPDLGCPCSEEGQALDCGKVTEVHDDYVTCSAGTRTCQEGAWGDCIGERVTLKSLTPPAAPGPRLQALGAAAACPAGFDACDPYCNLATDTAAAAPSEPGFSVGSTGVTLVQNVTPVCSSLTLTPSSPSVDFTGTSLSAMSAPPVTFTLTAWPNGCVTAPFATTWTIDHFDRATITGSTNTNGSLSVAIPISGNITVRVYAAGITTTASVAVKVHLSENPATDLLAAPNQAAGLTSGQVTILNAAPTAASSSATWLYPYQDTYFPLGLPAPTLQYSYSLAAGDETAAASAVRVSLRYPVNVSAAAAEFNYSIVVKEWNAISCARNAAHCNYLDPQIVIPELAWDSFEQSARGQNADLVVQRLRNLSGVASDVLEPELRRPIHFVDGQLKGSVYYTSYTSPLAGYTGAILKIAPGASAPTLAVQPNGECVTCHSINVQGTRLIANGMGPAGANNQDMSRQFDLSTPSPSPTTLASFTNNRFTYGGAWLDGSLYMSHGGTADKSWHAQTTASRLYRVSSPGTAMTLTNWPTDVQAITPRFSSDGTKMAFGYWTGSAITKSPSGTLSPAAGGTLLAVMDFSCASPPCTTGSTGWIVSNARDLTPSVAAGLNATAGSAQIAWPSFSPSGNSVIYQRQYRSSKALLTAWTPSDIGTVAGALAEIWLSNVPANSSTAASPTRLLALNGLSPTGTSYLPQQARTLVDNSKPLYNYPLNLVPTITYAVTKTGTGPTMTLSGTPNGGPWDLKIVMTNASSAALGTATFKYSLDGGTTWIGSAAPYITTAASVVLGTQQSGLTITANFATGTNFSPSVVYTAKSAGGYVGIAGTPQNAATVPWDTRISIVSGGLPGVATFKYSTNGGSSWIATLPIPVIVAPATSTTVVLGTTGLVATFSNVSYTAGWAFGALVSHYHQDNANYTMQESEDCRVSANATGVYDYKVNYLPSFAPNEAGGKSWAVFTSRRMYGNIAYDDAWDGEPGYACSSGIAPAKKLWMAAIDHDVAPTPWTPGTDPSHPAFYLPGQELGAGNFDGFWVSQACTALGASCQTDDDCCGGSGSSPTSQCRVTSTAFFPPLRACTSVATCAAEGASCTSGGTCCSGLTCPAGGGLCVNEPPLAFQTDAYPREYVGQCPAETVPKWRFIEWQSTIPPGTSVQFFVQTKQTAAAAYEPVVPLLSSAATATTPAGVWARGSSTVDQILVAAGLQSAKYLKVTMVFNPNSAGTLAPTLQSWRQIHDCVPAQ